MSSGDERELQPLIGDRRKRRGCCSAHPVLCSCTLTFTLVLSLAIVIFGAVFGSKLDQAVQDAIAEVMLVLLVSRGRINGSYMGLEKGAAKIRVGVWHLNGFLR